MASRHCRDDAEAVEFYRGVLHDSDDVFNEITYLQNCLMLASVTVSDYLYRMGYLGDNFGQFFSDHPETFFIDQKTHLVALRNRINQQWRQRTRVFSHQKLFNTSSQALLKCPNDKGIEKGARVFNLPESRKSAFINTITSSMETFRVRNKSYGALKHASSSGNVNLKKKAVDPVAFFCSVMVKRHRRGEIWIPLKCLQGHLGESREMQAYFNEHFRGGDSFRMFFQNTEPFIMSDNMVTLSHWFQETVSENAEAETIDFFLKLIFDDGTHDHVEMSIEVIKDTLHMMPPAVLAYLLAKYGTKDFLQKFFIEHPDYFVMTEQGNIQTRKKQIMELDVPYSLDRGNTHVFQESKVSALEFCRSTLDECHRSDGCHWVEITMMQQRLIDGPAPMKNFIQFTEFLKQHNDVFHVFSNQVALVDHLMKADEEIEADAVEFFSSIIEEYIVRHGTSRMAISDAVKCLDKAPIHVRAYITKTPTISADLQEFFRRYPGTFHLDPSTADEFVMLSKWDGMAKNQTLQFFQNLIVQLSDLTTERRGVHIDTLKASLSTKEVSPVVVTYMEKIYGQNILAFFEDNTDHFSVSGKLISTKCDSEIRNKEDELRNHAASFFRVVLERCDSLYQEHEVDISQLQGYLSEASEDVKHFIRRYYPDEQINNFFRDHEDFRISEENKVSLMKSTKAKTYSNNSDDYTNDIYEDALNEWLTASDDDVLMPQIYDTGDKTVLSVTGNPISCQKQSVVNNPVVEEHAKEDMVNITSQDTVIEVDSPSCEAVKSAEMETIRMKTSESQIQGEEVVEKHCRCYSDFLSHRHRLAELEDRVESLQTALEEQRRDFWSQMDEMRNQLVEYLDKRTVMNRPGKMQEQSFCQIL